MMVDPEIFVIGGGVSKAGQYLIDRIYGHYDHFTPISKNKAKIGLATLGNDAGIYGAAPVNSGVARLTKTQDGYLLARLKAGQEASDIPSDVKTWAKTSL